MRAAMAVLTWIAVALGPTPGLAAEKPAEKVTLRAASGQYLGLAEDGTLHATRTFPSAGETLELVHGEGDTVSLKAANGRWLTADLRDKRFLRADNPHGEPGERGTFLLVPQEENRVGVRVRGLHDFLVFQLEKNAKQPPGKSADKPNRDETVELYRVVQMPKPLCETLGTLVTGLAEEELAKKEYDKTRVRKTEKFADLPAPTLKEPLRTKRQRVLSVTDEYRVQAALEGQCKIEFAEMTYLGGYLDRGQARLAFAVRAEFPVRGHVRYRLPDVASASTGFRTLVRLRLVGDIGVKKSSEEFSLSPPEVREIRVELDRLDLSNDILQTLRGPIEDVINRELRHNEPQMREKANQAIAKAFKAKQLHHPLLQFLALP
jgi:hypothetical protein